jgi:hypothetical protein
MAWFANTCCMALGLMALANALEAGATPLSDPTRPYNTDWHDTRQPHTAGSYVLDSTLVSPARRVAVINGSHVVEGETVGNATVLRIRKHEVVLQTPNREITLKLLPDIVKEQP